MTPEEAILERYSTPGLRKSELSRSAKRDHLAETYKFMTQAEREELLDKLYLPRLVPRRP